MSGPVSTPQKRVVTTVRLPQELVNAVDALVDAGYFSSRSEFLLDATILLLKIAGDVNKAALHALEEVNKNPPQPATPGRFRAALIQSAWEYLSEHPPEFEFFLNAQDELVERAVDIVPWNPKIAELVSAMIDAALQAYFKEEGKEVGEDMSGPVSTPEDPTKRGGDPQ